MKPYDTDPAHIHHTGFGDFARGAAPALLKLLDRSPPREGLVVDFGCGSGIWARILTDAGYDVVGVDISTAMLKIARRRAPRAQFVHGSVYDYELPRCAAVTALGEVLGYAFEGLREAQVSEGRRRVRRAKRRLRRSAYEGEG